MPTKRLILRSFAWAVAFTMLFVLTLGAVAISLIVGDWIFLHTQNLALSWTVGLVVVTGFLITLGTGIGLFLWMKGPSTNMELVAHTQAMDILLQDTSLSDRD